MSMVFRVTQKNHPQIGWYLKGLGGLGPNGIVLTPYFRDAYQITEYIKPSDPPLDNIELEKIGEWILEEDDEFRLELPKPDFSLDEIQEAKEFIGECK